MNKWLILKQLKTTCFCPRSKEMNQRNVYMIPSSGAERSRCAERLGAERPRGGTNVKPIWHPIFLFNGFAQRHCTCVRGFCELSDHGGTARNGKLAYPWRCVPRDQLTIQLYLDRHCDVIDRQLRLKGSNDFNLKVKYFTSDSQQNAERKGFWRFFFTCFSLQSFTDTHSDNADLSDFLSLYCSNCFFSQMCCFLLLVITSEKCIHVSKTSCWQLAGDCSLTGCAVRLLLFSFEIIFSGTLLQVLRPCLSMRARDEPAETPLTPAAWVYANKLRIADKLVSPVTNYGKYSTGLPAPPFTSSLCATFSPSTTFLLAS